MVKLATLLVALVCFSAEALGSDTLNIAIVGDIQFHTRCDHPVTAMAHFTPMIDYIIANKAEIDLVVFPGDLTEHMPTGRAPAADCECLSQDPAPAACSTVTSWFEPDGCSDCADAEAMDCVGGTAGRYCEWTRARNGVDALEAEGIPVIWVSGNHDQTMVPSTVLPGQFDSVWQEYQQFFGEGTLNPYFKELGGFTVPLANYPRTASTVPMYGEFSSYHVLNALGTDWLFIAIGYVFVGGGVDSPPSDANTYSMNRMLAWAQEVILAHPGMPTVVISHRFWNETEEWAVSGKSDFYQEIDPVVNAFPQTFLNISGHFGNPGTGTSDGSGTKTAASGETIVGMVHDYSYDARVGDGLPAWVLEDNGGGGVIGMLRIDPRAGSISNTSYSPEEEERVKIAAGGDYTSDPTWVEHLPMCGTDRFNIAKSICNREVKVIDGCSSGSKATQNPSSVK